MRREAASVPLARRLLIGTMESAGVHPDVSYDLSLALTEACANAVEHGGAAAPGAPGGAYRVTAYLDGEKCRIEVADSGPGFPPGRVVMSTRRGRGRRRARRPVPAALAPSMPAMPSENAESGRGLCLIRELADHVDVGNKPGRGGAVISFDKVLKWREGAPLAV
ncbi:hypothetical protein STRAU_6443 [Streptomyces aurantiacus JA 4570]|uniref:Histidine kinase/HSP90-like ATPase domain-containing protein n=1 Tax=Streptomyces aurantiacus JA 4570 TaxID=1286094 RepID=S3Z9K5_9ACTN|nr:hypothetical protein STRAU_6443 [Streptomyces aurantiacus JA 4570]